jgi:hypothetical protein
VSISGGLWKALRRNRKKRQAVRLPGGRSPPDHQKEVTMDHTPPPTSLAAALVLPRTPGRSVEVFVDGDLEVRFAGQPPGRRTRPRRRFAAPPFLLFAAGFVGLAKLSMSLMRPMACIDAPL